MTKSFQKRIDMQHTSWPARAAQDKIRAPIRARIYGGVCRRDVALKSTAGLVVVEILGEDLFREWEEDEDE